MLAFIIVIPLIIILLLLDCIAWISSEKRHIYTLLFEFAQFSQLPILQPILAILGP